MSATNNNSTFSISVNYGGNEWPSSMNDTSLQSVVERLKAGQLGGSLKEHLVSTGVKRASVGFFVREESQFDVAEDALKRMESITGFQGNIVTRQTAKGYMVTQGMDAPETKTISDILSDFGL
jgi:hypothetical protein